MKLFKWLFKKEKDALRHLSLSKDEKALLKNQAFKKLLKAKNVEKGLIQYQKTTQLLAQVATKD